MNIFLKVKHWQLFLLIFGLPIALQFFMILTIIADVSSQKNPDPFIIFSYMKFFPIIMLVFTSVFLGWFWSVAVGLQKKVPVNVKMKVAKFKILFFIPLVYILSIFTFIATSVSGLVEHGTVPSIGLIAGLSAFIVPLHLFSMFCLLYSLYFVAKTFKTVELQRDVNFSDFAGEFFMIWFYPIGIWIIQPKINRMMEEESI